MSREMGKYSYHEEQEAQKCIYRHEILKFQLLESSRTVLRLAWSESLHFNNVAPLEQLLANAPTLLQ